MNTILNSKIETLRRELESLIGEKEQLHSRDKEIDIRVHQIVGALNELQDILSQVNQPSDDVLPSGNPHQTLQTHYHEDPV